MLGGRLGFEILHRLERGKGKEMILSAWCWFCSLYELDKAGGEVEDKHSRRGKISALV
jgi:hypothetical protein